MFFQVTKANIRDYYAEVGQLKFGKNTFHLCHPKIQGLIQTTKITADMKPGNARDPRNPRTMKMVSVHIPLAYGVWRKCNKGKHCKTGGLPYL